MGHSINVDSGLRLATIGFTKKTAQRFFELLRDSGARCVVDVRLNNTSQLAGFAKKQDLEWLLDQVCGIGYVHLPSLAPLCLFGFVGYLPRTADRGGLLRDRRSDRPARSSRPTSISRWASPARYSIRRE